MTRQEPECRPEFPVSPLEHDVPAARAAGTLTVLETAVLEFENSGWWKYAGAKEQAILDRFGVGATRYYQLLGALTEVGAAHRDYPMLIARLRRLRETRRRARSAGRVVG